VSNLTPEVIRLIQKGRKAEQRREAIEGCISSLIIAAFTNLFYGWLLKLAIGIAHDHWWPAIPTIGYWWAVLIVVVTPGVFTSPRPAKKDSNGGGTS